MSRGVSLEGRDIVVHRPKSGFTLNIPAIEAPAGTVLSIIGPSGSGKSTLLHVMGLLERPDTGAVLFDGRPVTTKDWDARTHMAAVFQRSYLFKGTVAENVGYGLMVRGVPRPERVQKVAAALATVGLEGYETRGAAQLSGGESQRVSLARALILEPSVLLLDEPLANLDPLLKRELTREFSAIVRDSGATVVWVTHSQEEALVAADQVAIIRAGTIAASGPAASTMSLPCDEWTASFLGLEPSLRGTVTAAADGLVHVTVGGVDIVATGKARVGEAVLLAVRPEDVTLIQAVDHLPASSARNAIRGEVAAIEPLGAVFSVVVDVGGARLASSVSRASLEELSLAPGAQVLASFKATAVKWRPLSETECATDTLDS